MTVWLGDRVRLRLEDSPKMPDTIWCVTTFRVGFIPWLVRDHGAGELRRQNVAKLVRRRFAQLSRFNSDVSLRGLAHDEDKDDDDLVVKVVWLRETARLRRTRSSTLPHS